MFYLGEYPDNTLVNLMGVYQDLRHSSTPQQTQHRRHAVADAAANYQGSIELQRIRRLETVQQQVSSPVIEAQPNQRKRKRKPRFKWTQDLHRRFIIAVFEGARFWFWVLSMRIVVKLNFLVLQLE
jgi:hypothetical protein